ncbi:MAG: WbqC family protein [Bacteroidia bacterium]|nr:WbqC family protein [Bacteroidia bacterium]
MNKPLPLYCLAGTDYFANIVNQKLCEISISEKYVKQSLRNRFYIMEPNKILRLSIPVKHYHQTDTISEIKIDYSENTMSKNWKSIESSYRNSPYFEYYFDDFYKLFNSKHFLLAEFNIEALRLVLKFIKSNIEIKLNPLPVSEVQRIIPLKNYKNYNQVFAERHGFVKNLSIIDLIFNMGPFSIEVFN